MAKHRDVGDASCILCAEQESIPHLFFSCCVARNIWKIISGLLGYEIGEDFESVARFWVANKQHKLTDTILSVVGGQFGN